jgi:hypothetical protein
MCSLNTERRPIFEKRARKKKTNHNRFRNNMKMGIDNVRKEKRAGGGVGRGMETKEQSSSEEIKDSEEIKLNGDEEPHNFVSERSSLAVSPALKTSSS